MDWGMGESTNTAYSADLTGMGESTNTAYSADLTCDTGNFECNICFELAQEPIVTLCGHLYCWPCLYQWLQLHSHSHECPVCKAIVQEEKLIPIYGRGKTIHDPRLRPGINVPNRPIGQRPQTALHVGMDHFRPNEFDQMRFMPMPVARFGHNTLSTLFGALPAIFNFQVHGFHDATVYGTTSGAPFMFSSSFHGGYVHGFHHHRLVELEWRRIVWKIVFVVLGILVLLRLILA